MNACRIILIITLFMAAMMVAITGCEYNAAEPLWYQEYQTPPTPVISSIEPEHRATPGINLITIHGENFLGVSQNGVYFDTTPAEVVQSSRTAITIRRPNLVTESCTIKVVPDSTLVEAKFTPYGIDPVLKRYGSFLDNVLLAAVAVDKEENLYVMESVSRNIYKITAAEEKTVLGTATRAPTDAVIGPDGRLYLPGNNRSIEVFDPKTGGKAVTWVQLPSGKSARVGDFDAHGYYFTGGNKTDLYVVTPALAVTAAGVYGTAEILALRVYDECVYVVSRTASTQEPAKIWKHTINADGALGAQQLVFDMSTRSDLSSRLIKSISFSSAGFMLIATDSANPFLCLNLTTLQLDYFYKEILPPYCKHLNWGGANFVYMLSGDTAGGQEWTVYRIDMGVAHAAK